MEHYEKEKIASCCFNIIDKAQAIMSECENSNPYKGYMLEKAQPILNDIQVIIRMCEKGKN